MLMAAKTRLLIVDDSALMRKHLVSMFADEGDFEIELIANDEILKNNQIKDIAFNLNVEITDLNGETRVAKKEVYVNQKAILLNAIVNNEYIKEENNKLTIKSTNYNSFPVDSKGEIKIYQIKEKSFLIDRNLFPEIQNITKEEFKNLFPHEPYEISDLENETVLIKTLYFDTQKSREINLNFLVLLDSTMVGSYYYNPNRGSLKLVGKLTADHSFYLIERDTSDSITGYFSGQLETAFKKATGLSPKRYRETLKLTSELFSFNSLM